MTQAQTEKVHTNQEVEEWRFCVAPMLDCCDWLGSARFFGVSCARGVQ